jgi:hypothetical protein
VTNVLNFDDFDDAIGGGIDYGNPPRLLVVMLGILSIESTNCIKMSPGRVHFESEVAEEWQSNRCNLSVLASIDD